MWPISVSLRDAYSGFCEALETVRASGSAVLCARRDAFMAKGRAGRILPRNNESLPAHQPIPVDSLVRPTHEPTTVRTQCSDTSTKLVYSHIIRSNLLYTIEHISTRTGPFA